MTTSSAVDVVRTASGKGTTGGALSGVHPVALLADLFDMVGNLEATGGRYGLEAACEAGGIADATIIERP